MIEETEQDSSGQAHLKEEAMVVEQEETKEENDITHQSSQEEKIPRDLQQGVKMQLHPEEEAMEVEQVETKEEDAITHQPSQEEIPRGPRQGIQMCAIELLRERNRAKMLELGLLEKEKPKKVGVKRKKAPAPPPSRRSARVKELPKVNFDVDDWEVEHF